MGVADNLTARDLESRPDGVQVSARKLATALDAWAQTLDKACEALTDGADAEACDHVDNLRTELRHFARSIRVVVDVWDQRPPSWS